MAARSRDDRRERKGANGNALPQKPTGRIPHPNLRLPTFDELVPRAIRSFGPNGHSKHIQQVGAAAIASLLRGY
jgi:hypothetical protein